MTVTATATVQTAVGALEVAVSDAATLAVTVSARDVQLVLSGVPDLVAAGSTFPVTVGTEPALLEGARVQVTVRLAAFASEPVLLTPGAPTASVLVTAPAAGGEMTLSATGEEADDNRLELNVLGAQAAVQVQVQEQVSLSLRLDAPPEVKARDSFAVTVFSEPKVPAGATVTVTVVFDGTDSDPVVLSAEMSSTAVMFTAPSRIENNLALMTSSVVTVADPSALQVTVADTATTVNSVRQSVQLVLLAPAVVDAGEEFPVVVSVSPALLADSTLTVAVVFGAVSTQQVTLTDTTPSQEVIFRAPDSDRTEVKTQVLAVAPADLVTVENATVQTVLVLVADAVELTLNAPRIVTVGSTFPVTVGVAAGISLMGAVVTTVSFNVPDSKAIEVTLSGEQSIATVQFTAPVTAGIFTVEVRDSPTAIGTAASVTVEPVAIMLRLNGPRTVTVSESYGVTVNTDVAIPEGTVVTVRQASVVGSLLTTLSDSSLTADNPSAQGFFTALERAGEVRHILGVTRVQTRAGSLQVRVANAREIRVIVEAVSRRLQLRLEAPPEVTARDSFEVTVFAEPEVPAGTTVTVTVRFEEDETDRASVEMTPGASMAVISVTAPDRLVADLKLMASGEAADADPGVQQVTVAAASATMNIVAQLVQLMLMAPTAVDAGAEFSVMVSVSPALLAATTLTVKVVFAGMSTTQVTLTDRASSQPVSFLTSPSEVGLLEVSAQVVAVEPDGLVVAAAALTQTVQVKEAVNLTLNAPESVTVGSTFPVTVGVAEETPLPESTAVTATLSFGAADSATIIKEIDVTLTGEQSTTTEQFMAPVMAGIFRVEVNSPAGVGGRTVIGASAPVTVLPVAVILQLNGPETVAVGQTYTVTVDTNTQVPEGTTLEVTVSDGTDPKEVSLTAANSSEEVSFTAPLNVGEVMVTATVEVRTAPDAREVAVAAAATQTVRTVLVLVADAVELTLNAPGIVTVGSTFPVTVGVAAGISLMGAVVTSVSFNAPDSKAIEVTLSGEKSTATVQFTAPVTAGIFTVEVRDSPTAIGTATSVTVEPVAIMLRLRAPQVVTVGKSYGVTVDTDVAIPEGTVVTVEMFTREGGTRMFSPIRLLAADAPSTEYFFIALERAGEVFHTGLVEKVETRAGFLQVRVADTREIRVTVEKETVNLTLNAPGIVTVGSTFPVTVGVAEETPLPEGLSTTATVSFRAANGEEIQVETVVLSAMMSRDTRVFRAPVTVGTYSVTVSGQVEETPALRVIGASAQVLVEPVAVQSTLTVSLQPGGMLTSMERAVPTEVYFDDTDEIDGLNGASGIAVSGDLLFVIGFNDEALSVWRVNAEAGSLSQTALYQDSGVDQTDSQYIAIVDGRVDGLNGARGAAVSGDGKLLFVPAQFADTISVWRVNAEAGTLSQTALYQDNSATGDRRIAEVDGRVDGLDGARGVAVSGDGKLLFVTALNNNSISVWRVNAEASTLTQTALYQDPLAISPITEVDGRFDGLMGADSATVSSDGKLLFVTAQRNNALSVWRVNALEGTLTQTALYRDSSFAIDGLEGLVGVTGPVISSDGKLLFVTAEFDDTLNVWRVNAEAGALMRTAFYQDLQAGSPITEADGRFDGLNGAIGIAVSGDLLFVTGREDDALSLWRVNAEAGTLSQTVVYQNGMGGINGLGGATGVAVSGDLLFVIGFIEDALSVWQINDAEVPFEVPVMIRVQSDMPVDREVTVTVTATNGADSIAAQPVTLSSDMLSDDAIFPAGDLEPGRWIFTAQAKQANPPTELDTSAARIAMQVLPALLSLEPQQDQFALGSTVVLTVRTIAGLPDPASFEIDAVNTASGETTSTITVEYPADVTEQEVFFPAQAIAMFGLGQLDFSIRLPDNSPFRVGDGPAAIVQIAILQLGLVPLPDPLPLGRAVLLTVRANPGAPTESTYNIIARHLDTPTTFLREVMHPAGVTEREVSFSARQIANPGQWEFSIQLPEDSPFQIIANGIVTVYVAPVLSLRLRGEFFSEGDSLNIGVQAESPPAVDAAVTITARRQQDGAEVDAAEAVMLSPAPEVLSGQAVFPAAALGAGEWVFTAQSEPPQALYTADARAEAAVLPRSLMLELSAPQSVTVGSTFPVTVRVAEETPLAGGVSVTATVSFRAAEGEEIQAETVVLSTVISPDTRVFRAPVTAGVYTLAVSGEVEETAALPVTVTGASASVTVVPVAVMLRLSGPAEAVSVGQDYTVMVDTTVAVPAGTTLEVTVRAGTATALQKEVSLTETISRLPVSFTAPARAGEVMVTATALAQTSTGSRQVAVSEAVTLTVAVSAREVQLALSEVPSLVAADSTFSVTVSAAPAVLAGTTVQVTVRLAAFTSKPVLLTPGAPMASVPVTAPATVGAATLFATGEAAADSTLDLNVLATEAVTVQVQLQVSLSLRLEAPPEVTARNSFAVTVFTEPEVPAGTTVTVTVVFDGTDSGPVVLSAEMSSTTVILTARRIGNNLALMTSSVVTVAEPNALRVMVTDADTSVNAVAQSVELTLMVSPRRVNIGEEIEVTVGVSPALLADTTLTVEVMADAASEAVTLTDATPSRQVRFTAIEAGPLEVSARVLAVAPADLVTVENTPTQTVQVREEGTVDLTLDAPSSVTVGNTFTVTVGMDERTPLPESVSVSATVSFGAADSEAIIEEREVTLSEEQRTATEEFTAPVTAGVYTLAVSGQVDETAALRVTVTGASASVTVVPVAVMLRLNGPAGAVSVGQDYRVTVDTVMPVPEDTTLEVTVRAGTGLQEVLLTAAIPSTQVFLTAPARAGEVMVTATALVQTSSGSRQVVVSDAVTLTVAVSAREVQLALSEVPLDLVPASSTFTVTVGTTLGLPEDTAVQVTVRLAAFASEPVLLTPGAPTASVLVTAPAAGGEMTLSATGEEAADSTLELNVLPAEAAVRVQVQVSLSLRLDAPEMVAVRDSFAVTVFSEPKVPAGATIAVTVAFAGSTQPAMLSADAPTATVDFMAPGTAGTFAVDATGTESVMNPDALQLTVNPASALVEVLPMAILQPGGMLTRMEHAVPTGVYFDGREDDGLREASGIAVSGDLLFVTAAEDDALSVWRVNAEEGTLAQTDLHKGFIFGLRGAIDAAVSSDGTWLFVTAVVDNTLSVWRVNAEAGTLSQTVVYQNNRPDPDDASKIIDGLQGARGIAISDDLLFVTAENDNVLSVWRVNAEAGTLTRTALYQNRQTPNPIEEVDGRFDGLLRPQDAVVSSDGALLFVTTTEDDTLSVWRVNAEAGTLTRTALYQNRRDRRPSNRIEDVDGRFDGLFRPREAALSSDGALLFVAASFGNALSVWRVNASSGTLSQTELYQNGIGGINGLEGATGVTVSGDLLFVTASSNDALSVWRVNASSGTLSQTELYQDSDAVPRINEVNGRFDGLDGAGHSAVSSDGDLLFVTAFDGNALSAWQINDAEVPFGVPVMISVQSGMPVDQEVTVTVTAQSGADSVAARPVTLSPSTLSANAIFPAGFLRPGRQIFTAQAQPPTVLHTSAARIAMQVLPPLLSLEPQQDQFALGSTVVLTVRTARWPEPASFTIDAINTASGETTSTITVEYSAGDTEQEVFFPAQAIAMFGSGQLDFFIRLPDNSPFRVGDGPAATVQIVISQLRLAPLPELLALGSTVILTVQANVGMQTEATYNIIARHLTSPTTFPISIAVMHPAGVTEREVSFSALQITSPGQWEFSIQLPEASPFQVIANGTATVYVAPVLSLRLQGEDFSEGDPLNIGVQAESPPAVDAAVTITARRQQDGVEVDAAEAVMLSPAPEVLSGQAVFPAAALGAGEWVFTAQSEPPQALYTADARAEAAVLPRSLMLELSAPQSVTVGSTFPVTVGVAAGTSLPESISVTATISFRAADAEEIQAETVVLTAMMSSATPVFRAPVTAGVYTLAVSGEVEETAALPVTVTGASASVTVVPVAVMLRLNGPAEAVSVGQDYTVMVDTTVAVPAGTTLEVTVRAGTATALQKEVSLTETISRLPVSFTAPAQAGEVMVTATALVQTSSGSRQVVVSDAVTLTVAVSALDVQLALSEVPLDLVPASSTFTVTVGTTLGLPEDTAVQVTVSLADFASEPVLLTPSTSTASVIVTAPAAGGEMTLSATGEEAADSTLELNVLATTVTVQVQVQVSLSLRLEPPPEVTARDSFAVTVFTEPEVPGGATVTVTVVFDGTDSSPVVLSAEMSSTTVILTARRIGNNLALMTSSVVTVAEPNALRVMVTDADTSVNAVAQSVELTLMVSPQRVNIGEEIEVTVGVAPALLADTTLTVEVMADAESEEVTLTDATPSRQVRFTAMEAGPLEVRARVLAVAPVDLVTVENTPTQTVQVREEGTVDLTLDAPKSVTVGDTFTVTVGVDERTPLPESVSVSATVSFRAADGEEIQAETAMLNAMRSSATRVFHAPVTAGVYTVAVSGQVEETAALRVTVTGASALVTAEPVAVMLRLSGPAGAVSVGQDYRVTVDTVMPVPEDTTLEVTVRAGTGLQEVLLTAAIPSTQVFLTAPARAGEVMVTATALAQTSSGSRQVAVSDAMTLTVEVSAREVQLVLSEVPLNLVPAESTFSVTVSAAPAVLEGTTVQVTVRLAAFISEPVLLTPGAPTASVLVTALAAGGSATLFATGEAAADSTLELKVLTAEAAVRVQVQVSLSLRLDAPEMVAVRDSFAVTVFSEPKVPAGATIAVTVTFAGSMQPAMLSADAPTATVDFMAPGTAGTFPVDATGTESVMNPDALQLTVNPASALVEVLPMAILQPGGMLTRMEHAVPTGVYFDVDAEIDGLDGASGIAVSGDLLFVIGFNDNALSVWRVNVEAGTLSQTALYQDSDVLQTDSQYIAKVDGRVDGLDGALEPVVSGDGKLLFVPAQFDDTLSVWRVNAEAGTLSQTAVYQDNRTTEDSRIAEVDGRVDGLNGASGAAVSGDGKLLFVTAQGNSALSVWRVNAEAGTLSQTALYQDLRAIPPITEVDGRFNGLMGAGSAAVSSDGKLLFVTAQRNNALSVWRVNALEGTLTQTALYRDSSLTIDGLEGLVGVTGPVISGDDKLLFVTAEFDDTLNVWRVNAEAGALMRTAFYQDLQAGSPITGADGRFDGLNGAIGIAVSGDLLFVTGREDDALSLWRVNASSGTLSQTVVYQNGMGGINGLGGAAGVAVSGDLLFVTGNFDNALSVWQINDAEVPFGVPVMIRVQSGIPVDQEVTVTVTAQSGADSMAARSVTLSPSTLSADAIFPPSFLRPGRWIFTAQAQPPTALHTSAARIAMQVLPPLLSLEPQQDQFALGSTVVLTVRTIAGLPEPGSFEIDAVNTASGETTSTITVVYSASTTEQEVLFPAEAIARFGLGQLDFFIRLPDNSPFRVDDGSTATVQIVISQLRLAPLPELLALGSTVILTVQANVGVQTEATYNIIARHLTSPTTFPISIAVMHPAGVTEREVSFSALQITSPGQWEFSIQLPEGSPFQVTANGTATVYVAPVLSLRLQGEDFSEGDPLNIGVQAESPPAVDAAVTITARRQQDGVEVNAAEAVMLSPAPEASSGQAVFSAGALGAGVWVFTAQSEPPQALYTANARAEATVLPPSLMLEISAPPSVTVGSTFTVTVGVAEETPLAGGVSVTATVSFRAADAEEIQAETLVLTAMMSSATPVFRAPVTAGVYTLAVSGEVEETAALPVTVTGASASVTVVPVAVMLRLNGPAEAVSVGQDYTVMVDTTVAVPAGTTLEVTVRAGTATALQKEVSLTETISRLPVSFTAPAQAGEVMVTATALVQTSSGSRQVVVSDAVTLTVAVSALDVQLVLSEFPRDPVAADGTFTVTVGTTLGLPEDTAVQVTVSLADFASEPVLLTPSTSTASVIVTAPAAGGEMTLSATGEEAADSTLELNVLATTVTVQVQVQVSLSLRLDAPPEVMARDSFAVTVFTEPEVPGGATVTVTVVFDGTDSSPVVLSAEMSSTTVILTARRIGNNLALMTSSVVTVAEPNALRVMVTDADTSVNAVAQSVELTLMVSPQRVNIGEEIEVTVGVAPALLADTTLTVEVIADAESEEVTLTDATPSRQVRFTAMEAGPLEVRARVLAVAPVDLVTVENTPTQTVQVQEQGTVDLTLDAPKSVTVGNTFTVTVGVAEERPLVESVSVTATVSFRAADGGEIQAETVVLTSARSSVRATFTAPDTAGRYTVAVRGAGGSLLLVIGTTVQMTVEPVLVLDVPEAPIYREVMFPVRVRLLGGLLGDNGSVDVTVYLRNAVTGVVASTRAATLSTAASSMVLMFEAIAGEAAITAYSLTTEDIDQTGLAPMTSLSLQSAAPATVFVTRINADLSGNGAFDADDAVLIARGLLTQNYLARSAGDLSQLGPDAFQARLSELADFADISGDGGLDIIDLVFLTRNADATASDLQSRVNADDNPFAYLCGSTASNACEGINSRHQNITLPGGIQYEAIGEMLDSLRRVPQPPMLLSPNNP